MKVVCLILFIFIISTASWKQSKVSSDSKASQIEISENEKSIKVSVCELQKNPANYNHKLIEVTGFISQGFENFSMFDPECDANQCIWLEYGGMAKSGTIYCCGETPANSRPEPLVVEDIPIPLGDDEKFRDFNKSISRPPDAIVHATIQGRFFSGEKLVLPGGTIYGGFGHFGMCSLFAIQKVVEVSSQENKNLDYRATADEPGDKYIKPDGGYEHLEVKKGIELQEKAESGEREWSFDNPQRVASEYLARMLKIDEKSVFGMRQIRKSQARIMYYWKNKKTKDSYMVQVSRQYWLSFYAKDPQKVAWIVIGAYKLP